MGKPQTPDGNLMPRQTPGQAKIPNTRPEAKLRLQAGTQGGTEESDKSKHGTAIKSRARGNKTPKAIGANKQPVAQTRMTRRKTHPRALKTGGKGIIKINTKGKGDRPRQRGNRKSRNETS